MYYLGVDAGGTKTEAVVVDVNGKVLGLGHAGSGNYHNVGLVTATTSVFIAVKEALAEANISASDLSASCIGIAAFDTPHDKTTLMTEFERQKNSLFGANLTVVNDTVIGLYAGTKPPGVGLVSGTGCNCYGRGGNGEEAFAGNWGYLLGDEGSGYQLATRIFRAVMHAFDGRGEKTILKTLVLSRLNIRSELEISDWVTREKPTHGEIAAFASLLDKALQKNDSVAHKIFSDHIQELSLNVTTVVNGVNLTDHYFDVVLIGSFFKTVGAVAAIEKSIHQNFPKANVVLPTVSGAIGATRLAKTQFNG